MLKSRVNKLMGIVLGLTLLIVGAFAMTRSDSVEAQETGNVSMSFSFSEIRELMGIFLGKDTSSVGALTGPEIYSPYMSFGGVREWAYKMDMRTATNTICAIQSPVATSTLVSASVTFKVSTTSAIGVDLARATTAYATTSLINSTYNIGANSQATIVASTSPIAGSQIIFGPNEYFVVKADNGTGTISPTGTCQAKWEQTSY